jgi:carboxypeptidase T
VRHKRPLSVVLACLVGALTLAGVPAFTAPHEDGPQAKEYRVTGPDRIDRADRTRIARTGAAVNGVEHGALYVSATPSEVKRLEALGYTVAVDGQVHRDLGEVVPFDFPSNDSGYHNYAEMVAEIDRVVAAYPSLVKRTVIGQSHEGRDIFALKISDNAAIDEAEPEVAFTHHQHAREHLTVEMALYTLNMLTSTYANDSAVRTLVDTREIWILPDVNPDGGEYDIATGSYRSWRKNRQPNAGSSYVGTDLNRNWDYKWGCCGGSSSSTSSDTYRGSAPFSGVESRVVADWVNSRVVGGRQQIVSHIDFHTYSELILWPFGWTYDNTAPGLSTDQESVFRTIGQEMADSNGYTPEQSSDLYITDGTISDWMWGIHGIWSYTFEMFPGSDLEGGFYPGDEVISRETSRNRAALLYFLAQSDGCTYDVIGKPELCAGAGVTVANPGAQSSTVGTAVSLANSASGGTAPYSWSASGLPAGLSINASTGTISGTPTAAGTSSVTVTATDSSSPVKTGSQAFAWTVNPVGACTLQTNGTNVNIGDNTTVESPVTVSGCAGNASATATVQVGIVHTYIGDLKVDLVAPDGSVYTLHNRAGGSADNINQTYTVNLSSEVANGVWKLRVNDNAGGDTGYLDTWTLNTGSGGGGGSCAAQTNGTNATITDFSTVETSVTVSGCSGNASATSKVAVAIVHTYIGDLKVDLVAPDGSVYTLHNRTGSGTDNINTTYTVNLSSEVRNGTWKLRVTDSAAGDTGYLDTWTLTT